MSGGGNALVRPLLFTAFVVILILGIGRFTSRDATKDAELGAELRARLSAIREPGADAGSDMDAPGHRTGSLDRNVTVTVLPFQVMSNGPDDDYFGAGLTSDLISSIALAPGMVVASGNHPHPAAEHVVTGTLSREASRLKISADLTHTPSGTTLWSQAWDQDARGSFTVRAEIALNIISALGHPPDTDFIEALLTRSIKDTDALVAWAKGLEQFRNAHSETLHLPTLKLANNWFEQVSSIEPGYPGAYSRHSDYYHHLLMAGASGELIPAVPDSEIKVAADGLRRDLASIISLANDDAARLRADAELSILNAQFQGLDTRLVPAITSRTCELPLWIHIIMAPFGAASDLVVALRQTVSCQPMDAINRSHLARAAIWSGDPPEGREALAEHLAGELNIADQDRLATAKIMVMLASGQTSAASRIATTELHGDAAQLTANLLLASVRGQPDAAAEFQDEYLNRHGPSDRDALIFTAWRGDRNSANRLAGMIDAREHGHLVLLEAIYRCNCGAPFDLESTPGLASLFSDSGLSWPPGQPIEFPLKSW
jgi:TolB-like protein